MFYLMYRNVKLDSKLSEDQSSMSLYFVTVSVCFYICITKFVFYLYIHSLYQYEYIYFR